MEDKKNKLNTYFSKISKSIIMMFLLLFSIISVSAIQFNSNQDITINDYRESNLAYVEDVFTYGNDNYNYTYNNVTWTYDIRKYYPYLGADMYIIYPNKINNNNIKVHITTFPQDTGQAITTTYNITMEQVGNYYFRLRPDYEGESIRLEIDADSSFTDDIKISAVKNQYVDNINSVTNTFIGSIKDFISIQIGFWKVFYYLFIFAIIIGSIGLLVSFALMIYGWAEKTSDSRKKLFKAGGKQ